MNKRVLLAYASYGGSTAGVAEAIGKTLSASGFFVDVKPIQENPPLDGYQAVIIGSAVHSGKWMPEAMAFVERNQSTLRRIPTAVFQVCMMMATSNENYKRMAPDWLEPLRAQIKPAAEGCFAGALFPNQYPKLSEKLGLRIFLATIKLKAGDYRNWDAIRAWTESLHPLLVR